MSFQDYVDELDRNEKKPNYRNIAMMGAAVILVVGLGFALMGYLNSAEASSFEVVREDQEAEQIDGEADSETKSAPSQICVYVTGHVANPGIVYLDEGARVADAIEACGGMTEAASIESLNLARVVVDGEQIQVQSAEELKAANDAAASSASSAPAGADASSQAASGKVNINTAESSELQTLSGVGESKAKKIIDYRQTNGPFKSIEDLANVSGIGEKTVESLRDSICI